MYITTIRELANYCSTGYNEMIAWAKKNNIKRASGAKNARYCLTQDDVAKAKRDFDAKK